MKTTVDRILIKSRNSNIKSFKSIRITSGPSTRNGKELIQPVFMNIFRNNTYTADLRLIIFGQEPIG